MNRINHKAFIRYQAIDRALKRNTAFLIDTHSQLINPKADKASVLSIEQLLVACNEAYEENDIDGSVNRSWLYKDLEYLKNPQAANAPIKVRRVNRMADYYYDSPNFSLWHTEWMHQTALSFIEHSLHVLQPELLINGDVFTKMRLAILEQLSDDGKANRVIYLDNEPHVGWHKYFDDIYKAIVQHQALHIKYQSFQGENVETVFMPQIIKEFNRRYFAFGLNEEGQLRNYPLDRIVHLSISKVKYIADGRDWAEYFDDLVGVTKYEGTEPMRVKLKIDYPDAHYFNSKPIVNGPLRPEYFLDYATFSFDAYLNRELENALMAFMPKIEVLAPLELRQRLSERLREGYERNAVVQ